MPVWDLDLERYNQVELLRGIRDLCEQIRAKYTEQRYLYVGIGRSPAPLIAYFQNISIRARTIPLSEFRPENVTSSITDDVLIHQLSRRKGERRIKESQLEHLFLHFSKYFPRPHPRTRVLLIDYTTSVGASLVAAQEQLQSFFQSGQQDIEVHALAICDNLIEGSARWPGSMVGRTRNPILDPYDWWYNSGQRQIFEQRWHVLPIGGCGQPRTPRQDLVVRAFNGQMFDDMAEYSSFPILTLPPGAKPTRYTGNPNEPAAYDVLRDELRNILDED